MDCDDKPEMKPQKSKSVSRQGLSTGSALDSKNVEGFVTFLAMQVNLLTQSIRGAAEYENPLVRNASLSTARQTLLSIEQQGKQYLAKAGTDFSEGADKLE